MDKTAMKRLFCVLLALGMILALGACSRLERIRNDIPPLPTPRSGEEAPMPASPPPMGTPEPMDISAFPTPPPVPTMTPTPAPTPAPTPTPPQEDPRLPHLFIENDTWPEDMPQYSPVNLYGEISTDKGVIAMVWGRILDANGEIMQNCKFYPYTDYFSLAGTVNAELVFGMLEPGHYAYVVSAIAENNSFSSGEVVLIEKPFEIYAP